MMSLSGLHSPHISMSSDFSSALDLREYEQQEELQARKIANENTPLIVANGSHHKHAAGTLNTTLLVTILAVTIGSSFQFGYGTGT